jgi:hypothetical protein
MSHAIARRPVAQRLREWLIARCLAPINIDGSQVSDVTIDGDSVLQVTMDGDEVFGGAIPDSGDLHARYDAASISAADGDSLSSWGDETGNGHTLSQSTSGDKPTYKDGIINSQPVVRFDDDFMTATFAALSQPNTVFMVFQLRSTTSTNQYIMSSDDGTARNDFFHDSNDDDWAMFAGNGLRGGSPETTAHIMSGLYNGGSSDLRIDGSQISSGGVGSDAMGGLTVGARYSDDTFAAVDVGELLIYPQDKSDVYSDVESYLSDKWGITI